MYVWAQLTTHADCLVLQVLLLFLVRTNPLINVWLELKEILFKAIFIVMIISANFNLMVHIIAQQWIMDHTLVGGQINYVLQVVILLQIFSTV